MTTVDVSSRTVLVLVWAAPLILMVTISCHATTSPPKTRRCVVTVCVSSRTVLVLLVLAAPLKVTIVRR